MKNIVFAFMLYNTNAMKWDLNAVNFLLLFFVFLPNLHCFLPFFWPKEYTYVFNDVSLDSCRVLWKVFDWNNSKHMRLKRTDSCSLNFSFHTSTYRSWEFKGTPPQCHSPRI